MCSKNYVQKIACLLLLFPLSAIAQNGTGILKSDWLELVKGYQGKTLGAEVVAIEEGDTAAMQKVTLAIPKKAISNPDAIEEVLVIGKMPEKPEPLDISYEWLKDYDKDNYGLVIRLGKNTNWPIRLYMNSDPGFMR
jgi:hypothetical protein